MRVKKNTRKTKKNEAITKTMTYNGVASWLLLLVDVELAYS